MTDTTLSNFVAASYKIACDHGFHDEELIDDHWLCLIVSEIMEAVEADRKRNRAQRKMFESQAYTPQPEGQEVKHWTFCFETFIKDTVEDELADVLIRILCDGAYNTGKPDLMKKAMEVFPIVKQIDKRFDVEIIATNIE